MSKKVKLLILMLSVPIIYLIYALYDSKSINYISLGDDLALGTNSFGITNYGYSDYFKDYLKKNNKLNIYINEYSENKKTITELYNDILTNKKIVIDNRTHNIKKLLRESDILTLSIGQNDIRYEINNLNKDIITQSDYKIISKKIFKKYHQLLNELNKYFKGDLYILGMYYRTSNEQNIVTNINDKIKKYCKDNNQKYIDITFISNNNYFDNKMSNLPNDEGYHDISKKLINIWNKENNRK